MHNKSSPTTFVPTAKGSWRRQRRRRRLLRRRHVKCSGRGMHFSCGIESKTTTAAAAATATAAVAAVKQKQKRSKTEKILASELKMQRIEFARGGSHLTATPPPHFATNNDALEKCTRVCVCVCAQQHQQRQKEKSLRASFHVATPPCACRPQIARVLAALLERSCLH